MSEDMTTTGAAAAEHGGHPGHGDHGVHGDHGTQGDPGYRETKSPYLRRLKLIEGQVRGVHRMVEEDAYCIDVLTQISAVTKALQSVATGLVDDHIHHCVHDAARSGDSEELERKMDEIMQAVKRLMK
ncbi:metal-sensitive transcriptional regulator [Brachybacterium sp. J153]|uniref:metal-sensitive transcriptional regulator n=1 Tax=Brachybacterium sp. J153 TaxID=3116488 RepID=UPI002E76B3D2|nr:metal-sensitive transcriptional regulator [Brachybacterium sp. J153]MEE1618039.1 metal-sensitive transcriptional regulator [Brachybacterium sp. J153]